MISEIGCKVMDNKLQPGCICQHQQIFATELHKKSHPEGWLDCYDDCLH